MPSDSYRTTGFIINILRENVGRSMRPDRLAGSKFAPARKLIMEHCLGRQILKKDAGYYAYMATLYEYYKIPETTSLAERDAQLHQVFKTAMEHRQALTTDEACRVAEPAGNLTLDMVKGVMSDLKAEQDKIIEGILTRPLGGEPADPPPPPPSSLSDIAKRCNVLWEDLNTFHSHYFEALGYADPEDSPMTMDLVLTALPPPKTVLPLNLLLRILATIPPQP